MSQSRQPIKRMMTWASVLNLSQVSIGTEETGHVVKESVNLSRPLFSIAAPEDRRDVHIIYIPSNIWFFATLIWKSEQGRSARPADKVSSRAVNNIANSDQ